MCFFFFNGKPSGGANLVLGAYRNTYTNMVGDYIDKHGKPCSGLQSNVFICDSLDLACHSKIVAGDSPRIFSFFVFGQSKA